MEKVNEDASLDFKWLIKRGVGGKKKEVRFYASFIYDGVEYALNDCVYMYKEGLQEPYIGKLTKVWENGDKTKKVKVHWFFRPEEISTWLGDTKMLENEILLASGEGVGLANISPLESIAGKCNVVCISKNCRNPQPSDEELKAADFIFYRTFDVESCTILDNISGEKVGGIEIEHVFNRRKEDESINTIPETTTSHTEPQQLLTKTLPNNLKDDSQHVQDKNIPNLVVESETKSVAVVEKTNSKIVENANKHEKEVSTDNKMEANKRKKTNPTGSDNLHGQPSKKTKLDDKNPPKEKQPEQEVDRDSEKLKENQMPSKKSKVDNSIKVSVTAGKISEKGKTGTSSIVKADKDKDETKASKVNNKSQTESDKLDDRPLKKMKSPPNAKQVEVEVEKMTDVPSKKPKVDDKLDDRPLKKMKSPPNSKQVEVEVEVEKMTDMPSKKSKVDGKSKDEVGNLKGVGTSSSTQEEKPNLKNNGKGNISDELEGNSKILKKTKAEGSFKIPDNKKNNSVINANSSNGKKLLISEGKSKSVLVIGTNNKEDESSESKKKVSMIKSPKDMYKEFVVSPKPNPETSGWFRRPPWEESLKNAYDQGTAVLLNNLDPDYTSGEVEDIIWHAFNEHCEAKILPRSAISSPHSYQALVLLKTKETAQRVLTKLDQDCLMLSNGRPLVGTPCPPIIARKNCKYFGHLVINKVKINQRETEEAVSTSHFSQPNTIEYEMAMDWFLLQSKSKKWWEAFNKKQGNELKELEAKFVKK